MSDAVEKTSASGTRQRRQRPRHAWRWIEDRLGLAFYAAALILVAVTGWAAYRQVIASGWNSDAAAWVQAAGSIAAIAGAAWLAQSEARRARRVRREQGEEAAWFVRFAIVQAQLEAHIIAAELVNRTEPVDESHIREWRQRATTSATCLAVLVGRSDYVHPAVSHVLSNAKVLMDDLVSDLAQLDGNLRKGGKQDQTLVGSIAAPHRALLKIVELYDARMRGIRQALDEGGDILPTGKWHTWNPDHEVSTTKIG